MARYKDLFHELQVGAPLVASEQITASGKLGNVLDRRDLDDPDGDLIGFIAYSEAVAAGDANNYVEITVHEADEKTDAVTLTAGAIANVGSGSDGDGSGSGSDVLGYTKNGVRAVSPNPSYDSSVPSVTQTEQPNVQDGVWPKVYEAGKSFWFAYRGYKNCLQIFAAETGTADVTVTVIPVYSSKSTRNLVNPRTWP